MLTSLWRLPIVLSLALLALIGGVVAFARTQPLFDALQPLGFHWCEDRLCFRGVKPSVTTLEAVVAMAQEFQDIRYSSYGVTVTLGNLSFYAAIKETRRVQAYHISRIAGKSGEGFPSLGYFVQHYGPPDRVLVIGKQGYLYFPFGTVSFFPQGRRLTPDMPMSGFVGVMSGIRELEADATQAHYGWLWAGFTDYDWRSQRVGN